MSVALWVGVLTSAWIVGCGDGGRQVAADTAPVDAVEADTMEPDAVVADTSDAAVEDTSDGTASLDTAQADSADATEADTGDAADAAADTVVGPPTCDDADHCVIIGADGSIDQPDLTIHAGESVAFALGDRWQSVVAIDHIDAGACDTESVELPWDEALGLTGPMPHLSGGIVVRGTPDSTFRFPDAVWQSPAVSGVLLVIPWRELEPTEGAYDFSVFTDALRQATRYGKLVSIGVQAGARCPDWIYEGPNAVPGNDMVTKATSGEQCFDQTHPSFWHPNYRARMTALQTALAAAVTARAGWYRHIDKIKISGVNLLTSETRMPVDREDFCGFEDSVCSGGSNHAPTPCAGGVCPIAGCGCHTDPADGQPKCGRTTDDLPQRWADAGYRPSKLAAYFSALFAEQHTLFPGKDINLMEIARAFPNVGEDGVVKGFADPDHVRALIAQSIAQLPDHFVVLNAALSGMGQPQDICMESYDAGAAQIGFQTTNGLNTFVALEPALDNARDAQTPAGVRAVSFVEIYLNSFLASLDSNDEDGLAAFDAAFRARAGEDGAPPRHRVASLPVGTYHYKIGGNAMTGSPCATGTITVEP